MSTVSSPQDYSEYPRDSRPDLIVTVEVRPRGVSTRLQVAEGIDPDLALDLLQDAIDSLTEQHREGLSAHGIGVLSDSRTQEP